jgi:uncharacterized protein (TIGR00266 family)
MRYSIEGGILPYVVCNLDAGESILTEKGAMSWMSPNMQMQTKGHGGFGKMVGRAFSGESMFQNIYTAQGGPGMIALASSFPGAIMAFMIQPGQGIIAQKRAFLASEMGVELSVHFQKKLGAGFFGGEGFIMQRYSGYGIAFLEIDGSVKSYDLGPGETMIIDTGYLVAMSESCSMDIQTTGGVKNALLGGEGLFNTVLTGPGRIYLQAMPLSKLASVITIPGAR